MESIGELFIFIVIAVIWGISQLARAGGRKRRESQGAPPGAPRRRGPRPRPQGPASERESLTLEDWMERVRQGHMPRPPTEAQPRQRQVPTAAAPQSAEGILRQWQERTQQPQQEQREAPPPRPQREGGAPDPYATPQERTRRGQEAARAQREALAKERERERRTMERREAERERHRHSQQQQTPEREHRHSPQQRSPEREPRHSPRQRSAPRRRPTAVPRRRPARSRVALPPEIETGRQAVPAAEVDPYARGRLARARPGGLDVTQEGLRTGILMAEILGPPVALRPPPARRPLRAD